MKRKIIVCSIIAVVILVLVSFTSVVGYRSVKSTTIAETSPLFKLRLNREIGEESKILTCKYIGKGITLPFPERDNKKEMVQRFVDTINKMDDEIFDKFIGLIMKHPRHRNNIQEYDEKGIFLSLNKLRDNPDSFIKHIQKRKDYSILTTDICTLSWGHIHYKLYN